MKLDEVQDTIRARLAETGLSAAEVSRQATGQKDAIKRLLRGHKPSVTRLSRLCDALDLEFYVGPGRGTLSPTAGSVSRPAKRRSVRALERLTERMARAVAELKQGLEPDEPRDGWLSQAVPVRGVEVLPRPEHDYSHEDEAAASSMTFEQTWIDSRDIDLERCLVVSMQGDWMEPALPAGALLLVDRRRQRFREGHIFVVRRDLRAPLLAKRIGREGGALTQVADNHEWDDPVAWEPGGGEVIGEVIWATAVEGVR